MVAFFRRQRLNLPLAPLAAAAIGIFVAILFALMPTGMLEDLLVDSGIAAVVSAAAPPLGYTARVGLVLLCGGAAGAVAWFALFLLLGNRSIVIQESAGGETDRTPVLRRADAHPDAPARRPLSAIRDLGTPFFDLKTDRGPHSDADDDVPGAADTSSMAVTQHVAEGPPPEQALPADLDQPLAAFDPDAIPEDPIDWSPGPASITRMPRRQTYDPGDRFETFELTPMVRKSPAPLPASAERNAGQRAGDPSESIHALLDRLERSVGRQEPSAPPPPPPASAPRTGSLEDALTTLRQLATRH